MSSHAVEGSGKGIKNFWSWWPNEFPKNSISVPFSFRTEHNWICKLASWSDAWGHGLGRRLKKYCLISKFWVGLLELGPSQSYPTHLDSLKPSPTRFAIISLYQHFGLNTHLGCCLCVLHPWNEKRIEPWPQAKRGRAVPLSQLCYFN